MWRECKALQDELAKMRRELHQIPEFGMNLPETQKYVINELEKLEIPYKCSGTDSSIIAEIKGGKPGKTVALRADMDALKITEANEVDYKSKHEGMMHACGHDAHITMLLGAAKILAAHKDEIKGNVRLLFQTGEELSKGAQIMIADGALDGVDAIFGQHIGSLINKEIPAGKVIINPGCCMASFDRFVIKVNGTGCHGSTPEKGIDPVNIASHIVIALQEIIAREVSATKAAVATIGMIHGGFAYNVIPGTVEIEGTIRALEEPVRQYVAKRIGEIAKNTAITFGGTAEVEIDWGAPPVINDDAMAKLVIDVAKEVVGEDDVVDDVPAPNMAGEDFAYLPMIEKDEPLTISQYTLKEMIRQTIFSIAVNENNKLMTGELFEIKNNCLKVVSLDGHRISIRKMSLKKDYSDRKVVVPGKTLSEVSKILSGEVDDQVSIYFTKNHILFEFDQTMVVSRLIEGEYFRIDQMLSSDYETKLKINKKEFLDCIDRATLLVREVDKKPIIINITDDDMELRIDSAMGSMNEEIDIEKEGKDIMIGFNPKFLIDALRVIDDETVTIYLVNPKAPCFIRDDEENYTYLILPVNINQNQAR